MQHLPLSCRLFIVAVCAAGLLVLACSIRSLGEQPLTAGWATLAMLTIATGSFMLKVPGVEGRVSLSDTVVFAAVLLFGPAQGAILFALDALVASLRFNRSESLNLHKALFNVCNAAISSWVPGTVFFALLGSGPLAGGPGIELPSIVLPLAAMVVLYSVINTGIVSSVIALQHGLKAISLWRDKFGWIWLEHAWSASFAAVVALYIPRVNAVSLAVIGGILVITYATLHTYLAKVGEANRNLRRLNELYLSAVQTLAMAIDAKDQVTHGHIRRVQAYAIELAKALGITDGNTLQGIEAAALLHDTGKIAVPEHILNKPGRLTECEFEQMKTHVTVGVEILGAIDFPYPVLPFVRHHHENWDGGGYPDGLRGEAIPLGARILSVVDCFDALTSDRPYRRRLSDEQALDILRERSGSMYDPRVVARFLEMYPRLTRVADEHLGPLTPRMVVAARALAARQASGEAAAIDDEGGFAPALDAVIDLAPKLSSAETASLMASRLRRLVAFASCAIYVVDPRDEYLQPLHASGPGAEHFQATKLRLGDGPSGWVAAFGQVLVNVDPALDLRGLDPRPSVHLASALVAPLGCDDGFRGAVALYASNAHAFSAADAATLERAARVMARALGQSGTAIGRSAGAAPAIEAERVCA